MRLLLLSLVCFTLFQGAVVAPAVGTVAAACPICTVTMCAIPTTTLRPIPNFAIASDPSPDACTNIHHCRTLVGIVQSCLATIFACVWTAIHPNISGPKKTGLRWSAARNFIHVHLESLKVLFQAVLLPEWILAWAVRQGITAWKLSKKLEAARVLAKGDWEKEYGIRVVETDRERASIEGEAAESDIQSVAGEREDETPLTMGHLDSVYTGEAPDLWKAEARLGRTTQRWTIAHAFFVIMGGFQIYDDGKPLYPLHPDEVVKLVRAGTLVPPTLDELTDRSKGDAFSKGCAILQTLWFVLQCIARGIEHLPITILEVMTLAYTVITLAMYAAWWHKPLNISCPIRVPGTAAATIEAEPTSIWQRLFYYVAGNQDEGLTLSQMERVPTFWAGGGADEADLTKDAIIADIIALLVAMVFGAVHCIAWSYAFPSHAEQLMWRTSAITIVAAPAAISIAVGLWAVIDHMPQILTGPVAVIGVTIYILARLILLALSFTTLRSLASGVYHTVQWTTLIPHI